MLTENAHYTPVSITLDLQTIALVHKLMVSGLYHARLSQKEFDNAKRGQAMLENVLLQTGYYDDTYLRMILESVGTIIRVAP
jgi:hypothetical protein